MELIGLYAFYLITGGLSILLGITVAKLGHFIDFCFNEGNILDGYYRFLLERVQPRSYKLFKLLGGCNVCFTFWLATFFFVFIFNPMFYLSYFGYIIYVSFCMSHNIHLNSRHGNNTNEEKEV